MSFLSTKRGDGGMTDTGSGQRARKDDALFAAMGSLDELQAHIGVLRCHIPSYAETSETNDRTLFLRTEMDAALRSVQQQLSNMCYILTQIDNAPKIESSVNSCSGQLSEIEKLNGRFELLRDPSLSKKFVFVVPGDTHCLCTAQLHVCRTVCRRCERNIVSFGANHPENAAVTAVLRYINRLSDFFFAATYLFGE